MIAGGGAVRRARVRAPAKINLDLRVLGKRPDGYHELRTIFQTISLADTIEMAFTPGRKTTIELTDDLGIPGNLISKAAGLVMEALRICGRVEMRLVKRIPMGAGLGGGSSDAAAVLLALPVLAGRNADVAQLHEMAHELGSDVPFFLLGGRAVGIGRGTELFPLPDRAPAAGVLATPAVHVNTALAYARLSPRLTTESQQNKMVSFQTQAWDAGCDAASNDFEEVVFEQHRSLALLKRRLLRAGASTALMTGSGSALFGLFRTTGEASRARESLGEGRSFRFSLVSRERYRRMWWRALGEHSIGRIWPPKSRYAR